MFEVYFSLNLPTLFLSWLIISLSPGSSTILRLLAMAVSAAAKTNLCLALSPNINLRHHPLPFLLLQYNLHYFEYTPEHGSSIVKLQLYSSYIAFSELVTMTVFNFV